MAASVSSWSPDRIVFGEWDITNDKSINLCPMLWYGGTMDESSARTASEMTSDLKSLDMLYLKAIPLPPWQEEQ